MPNSYMGFAIFFYTVYKVCFCSYSFQTQICWRNLNITQLNTNGVDKVLLQKLTVAVPVKKFSTFTKLEFKIPRDFRLSVQQV